MKAEYLLGQMMLKRLELAFSRDSSSFLFNDHSFLVGILLAQVALWLIYPKPFDESDPWRYSLHAYEISTGSLFEQAPNEIFAYRLGVTIPTAAFYKLFGINSITTNLWPLLMSCTNIVLVWVAAPKGKTRRFAVLLFATNVIQFEQSATLMPDLIVSTFMMASSVLLFRRHDLIGRRSLALALPLLSAITLWLAFLTKLTVYWVLLIWIMTACHDLIRKRWQLFRRLYLPCLLWGILLGCVYLFASIRLWGDPLARLAAVQDLTGQHLWSWDNVTPMEVIRRLTYEPIVVLILKFPLVFVLSVGGMVLSYAENRFWVFQYLVYLFLWWFGSSSFNSYQPLPLSVPRMILPALPAMVILGGSALSSLFSTLSNRESERSFRHFGPIFLMLLALSTASAAGNFSSWAILLLLVLLVAMAPLPRVNLFVARLIHYQVIGLLIAAVACIPLYHVLRNAKEVLSTRTAEMDAVKEVKNALSEVEGPVLMLTMDTRSPESLAYYWDYQYPKDLIIHYYGDYQLADSTKYEEVLIFNHKSRSRFLSKAYDDPFLDPALLTMPSAKVLYDQHGVQLVEISSSVGEMSFSSE